MTSKLDIEEIRRGLTAHAVLAYYQHPTRRGGGRELESSACPRRADHSRRAFTINTDTARWRCYPCAIAGDNFRLVAEFERLDDRTNFPAVLARAAEIAGVTPSTVPDAERERRRAAWRAERFAAEARYAAERKARDAAAVPTATAYWADLAASHARGLAYLEERGLAAAALLVRFDGGSPAIPLHTRSGAVRNVVCRRLPELGEPKTPGLPACPTAGTMLGTLGEIAPGRVVVVTEGVADTITAALAWPGAVILGAHGACNLLSLTKAAAPRVLAAGGRLLLVPHNDDTGRDAATEAGKAAVTAGLSILAGTLQVIRHGEKDLNDAWRGGWRANT